MLDLKLLRDDPEAVRASQRARREDPDLVDQVLAADEQPQQGERDRHQDADARADEQALSEPTVMGVLAG